MEECSNKKCTSKKTKTTISIKARKAPREGSAKKGDRKKKAPIKKLKERERLSKKNGEPFQHG